MKHTTEELLLAAAVRKRVGEMRLAKTRDMTDEEEQAFRNRPANDLIAEALTELTAFASVIAKLRQSE